MELIEKIKKDLKENLSEKRYTHSIGVMNMAVELAQYYNADVETAKIAGLLHVKHHKRMPSVYKELKSYISSCV